MTDFRFPWILMGLLAAVDVAGFFYLWRRRNSPGLNHGAVRSTARPIRMLPAERRRRERRGS
jgi:hypothetical protein